MSKYSTILFPLLVVFASCSPADQSGKVDKFTGRWSLHIVETKADSNTDWEPRQDHYKNRQGFIIYDGRGGMGVHHVTQDYDTYQFEGKGNLDSFTHADLRHLADNFVYFGKYRVIDSLGIIEHHIESANFQNMWGTIAKRKFSFSGDTLTLMPVTDRYPKTRLKWVRVNDMEG